MKNINTKNSKREVWLVKMPKYVGDQIKKLKSGEFLGVMQEDGDISLNDFLERNNLPIEHVVNKHSRENMHLISEESILCGEIKKELFFNPVITRKYLEFKRKNKGVISGESRSKVINYFEELRKGEKYAGLKEMELQRKLRKEQLLDRKRERLDKNDVIDILFKAFEKYEYWTVKDLADFSGQPIAFIQEIIGEIAVLNKKDHRNTYELKPQFK
ncbi:hypothetical protein NUSPORA_00569 [Nucleospora cyclopteri]